MSRSVSHSPRRDRSPLAQWIERTLRSRGTRIKFKLKGNNLHILCEGKTCPDQTLLLTRVLLSLQQTDLNRLIPPTHPRLYQLLLYGRQIDCDRPAWGVPIHLSQIEQHLEALQQQAQTNIVQSHHTVTHVPISTIAPPSPVSAALMLTNQSQAKQGNPDAVARYLSETLSLLGVSVRVSVKTTPYPVQSSSAAHLITPEAGVAVAQRLWITCEALYSPDPMLVGEPIAQQVRDLQLEGFRDAVIVMQVRGEVAPDWLLQIDLTPTQEMLREWARWGDVSAIARVVSLALGETDLELSTASLQDATLHLFFSAPSHPVPNQHQIITTIVPVLETIAPQGIHGVMLYGQLTAQEAPAWVEWVTLPASHHPALAESALTLAKGGDWGAIAFLLNRLLNPDLDRYLTTGGVRLQILPRSDLLHVMTDAVVCPAQAQVGTTVAQFFRQLQLAGVAGVRVYGRRAGQKHPAWSYGVDFVPRQRLVPEVTPQFAVSDAYVGELIAQPSDAVLRSDLTSADIQTVWGRVWQAGVHQLQQAFLKSRLFMPVADRAALPQLPGTPTKHRTITALVWAAVGLLATVQLDWALYRALDATAQSADNAQVDVSPAIAPSPTPTTIDPNGFTSSPVPAASPADAAALPYTQQPPEALALTAAVLASDAPFSTFNSQQLDEKLKLYQRQLEQVGPTDVLVVGSSRALRGVDPAALEAALAELGYTDVDVFNFGVNGATAQVVDLIVRRLLTPEQLPRLIVWADGARAFNSGTVDVTYNGIAASQGYGDLAAGKLPVRTATPTSTTATAASPPPIDNPPSSLTDGYESIDRWLSQQLAKVSTLYAERDQLKQWLQNQSTAFFPDQPLPQPVLTAVLNQVTGEYADASTTSLSQLMLLQGQETPDLQGFLPLSIRFNPATYYQKYARVPGEYDSDYENFQVAGSQEAALQAVLNYTRSHQIPVVFVNLPLTQDYLDPTRLRYEQTFEEYMRRVSVQQGGLIYRDLSEAWMSTYDYFSDPSHLNRYGAYQVSNRLAQDSLIPWHQAVQTKN